MTISDIPLEPYGNTTGVLTFNVDNVLINADEQYLALSGFTKEDLLGKSLIDFGKEVSKSILEDFRLFSSGECTSILTKKDGYSFPVEIHFVRQRIESMTLLILIIKDLSLIDESMSKISVINEVFRQAKEAILVTDNQGHIISVNKKFSDITGYSKEDIIGKTPAVLNSGKQDKYFYKTFWQKLLNDGCWHGEIWNRRRNGEVYPEWLNISSVRDEYGHITHYIALFTDITKRKKSQEEQHFQAYHDSLTNLPNRNFLFEKLKHLCKLDSEGRVEFAVLFCDLDRFKLINDTLGHDVGDELLKSVATRFESKLRDNDIIARSGGDEFIVVIEGEKALKNLDKICLQILSLFDKPFQTKFGEFKTSLSVGVSQFPSDSIDLRELISFADVAMLKVKELGGNDYSLFDKREKKIIQQRLELEREINNAIKNNNFEVWYQPQINASTDEVYGIECLLRWNHPEEGLISPNLFIPIAEANGSIKELGQFVIKTACQQLRKWRVDNVFTGVMAINVSIRQFDRNDLLGQVRDTLIKEMIPAEAIEIEVTESLFSEDNTHVIPTLIAIRDLGVKVAIDDFGTGYSSLQRLKSLPVDNVKIDKCFVDNIVDSDEDCSIIKAIILLSKTFKFNLIAEGIEQQVQADKLIRLGCGNHQGFLYSKPLRACDFEIWLNKFNDQQEQALSYINVKEG